MTRPRQQLFPPGRRGRNSLGWAIAVVFSIITVFYGSVSGHESPKLCDSTYQPMYCRCNVDEGDGEEPTNVQCFVTTSFTANDAFLKIFEGKASIQSLSFTTYASGTHKMDFVPTVTLSHMPNLERLKFYQVNLGTLEKRAFHNLSKLAVLSLDSNEIIGLDKEAISQLPLLRKIELADNNLTSLAAGVLTELPSLTHLYLEKNQVTWIEDMAFSHLSNLLELDLSDNAIENLTEGTFKGLDQLTRLDLFRNKLRRLGARVFSGAPMLAELDLKYNAIVEVDPQAFDGLPKLAILYLSYNRLRVLPANMFLGAPNLMTVDLSQNKLVTLTWRTLQDLASVDTPSFDLSLTGNQFSCDCRLAWMLHMENATRSDKFRRELRHVKCDFDAASPPDVKGAQGGGSSKVARLSLKQLGCGEDYVHPQLRGSHTIPVAPSSTPDSKDDEVMSTAKGRDKERDKDASSADQNKGTAVDGFQSISTEFPPTSSSFGDKEGATGGDDMEEHGDQSLKNDADAVLSQQKTLSKQDPPRKKKPQPAGVNSAAVPTASVSFPSCLVVTWVTLAALMHR